MKKWIWLVCMAILAGCTPVLETVTPSISATRDTLITPYHTPTPRRSATPLPNQPTPTPPPTLTPTPRVHVVKTGEDMSGIALRYRVSLSALKTANPTINPRIIIVGQQIIIPASTPIPGTSMPTATAVTIIVNPPRCLVDGAGGAWCFTTVKNLQTQPVESVTVRIRLLDEKGKQAAIQTVTTALDLLSAGKTLPVGVYFPAPLPPSLQVAAELVNALPVQNLAARYLPVSVEGLQVQVAPDQMSATVSGNVVLVRSPQNARQFWLVASAFNADGDLVGVRRWESNAGIGTNPVPFTFSVYAVGEKINRVEVQAEARP